MILLGLLTLALFGVLLATRPKTNQVMKKRWRFAVVLVIALLAFAWLHPYIFGLPGRIAEIRFERNIHKGMTRSEIVRLALKYGGSGPLGPLGSPTPDGAYDWRSDGALDVQFTDFATFCIVGGKWFRFYFLPNWTLTQWEVQPWGNAC
ncbi:MAG: hypothetical protein JO146_08775 [Candidatus Eremiobacteraeota bacterium]|nr:hypothetical protein [Candidatus Eremiobacteraeota bacterium]